MNKKILTIISVVLFLDQVSKNLISSYIGFNKELIVIPNFFSLTNVNNYGAAWSILDNQTSLLIVITIIVLVVIYRYMNTFKENTRNIISFGLLFGGISGNLIDRLFLGYVRDFLSFIIYKYNFPIFNVSDISIVLGTILLMTAIMKGEDSGNSSKNRKIKNR